MTALAVWRFWRFWRTPCPPFACSTKYSAKRRRWRFWRFWRFRRLWRFWSWRLPPLKLNPPFPSSWFSERTKGGGGWWFLIDFFKFWGVQEGFPPSPGDFLKLTQKLWFRVPGIELKNPSSQETRKNYKKKLQNPPPRVGPRKYEKNTEKKWKWPKNDRFRIFSVFFSYFRGPTRDGRFRSFSYFCLYFRAWGSSIPGTRNRNPKTKTVTAFPVPGIMGKLCGPVGHLADVPKNKLERAHSLWLEYCLGAHLATGLAQATPRGWRKWWQGCGKRPRQAWLYACSWDTNEATASVLLTLPSLRVVTLSLGNVCSHNEWP